jgi:hypothetical protein
VADSVDTTLVLLLHAGISKTVDSAVRTLRLTGLANATVYKIVIQNAFFTTQHFHFPARRNYMFGWIFWTSHTLPINQYETMTFDPAMRLHCSYRRQDHGSGGSHHRQNDHSPVMSRRNVVTANDEKSISTFSDTVTWLPTMATSPQNCDPERLLHHAALPLPGATQLHVRLDLLDLPHPADQPIRDYDVRPRHASTLLVPSTRSRQRRQPSPSERPLAGDEPPERRDGERRKEYQHILRYGNMVANNGYITVNLRNYARYEPFRFTNHEKTSYAN